MLIGGLIDFDESDDIELKTLPTYLENDIRELMAILSGESDEPLDCLLGEVYGSIHSAQYDNSISEELARKLMKKYFFIE